MIQVTPHMRVFVAREPLDFRTRIDGTAAVCRKRLKLEPMSGALFVFRNRAATMVRILVYDGQGFWNMTKRLSKGRFRCLTPRGRHRFLVPGIRRMLPRLPRRLRSNSSIFKLFGRDRGCCRTLSEKEPCA